MKKTNIIAIAAAFSLTLTAFPMLVHGDEAVYSPENDPLVSLSYIENVVTPAYEKRISELEIIIDDLTAALNITQTALGESNEKLAALEEKLGAEADKPNAKSQYEVVYLQKGAKLMAESSCEIILRSGSAIVVSITVNGINNLTNGTELLNAAAVPLFSSLLVPRGGDGRGIQITSNDAYVMVRGDYTIVQ